MKSLGTLISGIAQTFNAAFGKQPVAGSSRTVNRTAGDVLPPAPVPVQVVPNITPPVLNFQLPIPGQGQGYEEEAEHEDMEVPDDDEGETLEYDQDDTLLGIVQRSNKARVAPEAGTKQLWGQYRKKTNEFRPDDWRKPGSQVNIKAYTEHPEALMFKAPEIDAEAPDLRFKDRKEREKKVSFCVLEPFSHFSCFRWRSSRVWLEL